MSRHRLRRRPPTRLGRPWALLLLGLALCACGPDVPLDIAVRQANVDVAHRPTPTPAPAQRPTAPRPVILPVLPPMAPVAGPVVATPRPASPSTTAHPVAPPAPPPPCPAAPQLSTPAVAADAVAPGPPAPAHYAFRYRGSEGLGAPASTPTATLGPSLTRTVTTDLPPATSGGQLAYGWTITETDGKAQAAWVFQLFQPSTSTLATAGGVYVAGLEWKDPVRGDLSFAPATAPLELFPLPVSQGLQYASTATDTASHTTIAITGSVTGRDKVDACGTVLDSWTTSITGTITTPAQQLQLTATYQVATQFGGLIVGDHVTLSGPDSAASVGQELTWDATSTISSTPAAPRDAG